VSLSAGCRSRRFLGVVEAGAWPFALGRECSDFCLPSWPYSGFRVPLSAYPYRCGWEPVRAMWGGQNRFAALAPWEGGALDD
jgi:hypothetical protein